MRLSHLKVFPILLFALSCSTKTPERDFYSEKKQQVSELSKALFEAEKSDDLQAFLSYYKDEAISLPEFQLMLVGKDRIKVFYKEIFQRQSVEFLKSDTLEIIDLGNTLMEIGSFEKRYSDNGSDQQQRGKYFRIWEVDTDGDYKIKAETFGFFHPIENPERLVVEMGLTQPDESDILIQKEIPFELKAYNALMEKGVRTRNGNLRADFFAEDGLFMPFAHEPVAGMKNLRPYLLDYSSGGQVNIDSISCYTYDYQYFDGYLLEYAMFKVKWSTPDNEGRTEGNGIRLWKRMPDHSLRLYRESGTHNYIK